VCIRSSQHHSIPPPVRYHSTMSPYQPVASSSQLSNADSHLRPPNFSYQDDEDSTFDLFSIDLALRLRTVRTAHSVIAESIRVDDNAERRKRRRRMFSGMKRRGSTITTHGTKASRWTRHTSVTGTSDGEGVSDHGVTPKKPRAVPAPSAKSPSSGKGKGKALPSQRRAIHVNLPLPAHSTKYSGDPITRYIRNKVRASKYTILDRRHPKEPSSSFDGWPTSTSSRCATNAQIGMLPLLAILGMTAIKDGVEDWRRAKLDDEVNDSATTKLGSWRNVNQPRDPRSFVERLLNIGPGGLSTRRWS